MRAVRTRRQLESAGETPATLRAALDSNQARVMKYTTTEDGAKRFDSMQRILVEELATLEGRRSER